MSTVVQAAQTAVPAVQQAVPVVVAHPAVQQGVVWFNSVAPSVLAFLTGTGISVFHTFVKRDGWDKNVNRILIFVYAILIALLDAYLKGTLSAGSVFTFFLAVLGGAQAWFTILNAVGAKETSVSSSTTATPAVDLPVTTNP